jgi:CheY-like chemotaxis protein
MVDVDLAPSVEHARARGLLGPPVFILQGGSHAAITYCWRIHTGASAGRSLAKETQLPPSGVPVRQASYRFPTGAHGRIRTCGLLLRRQSLYPLSYVGGERPDRWRGAYGTIPPRQAIGWRNRWSGGLCYAPPGQPLKTPRSCRYMINARILVVDDDRVIQQLLKVNLELEGYAVAVAEDGEEALAQFDVFHPNLVLLDIMMPKLDGWEVCRRLKAGVESNRVPIVLLSARAQEADVQRGMELGVAAYVTKPFDPISLLDMIADILTKHGFNAWEPR